MIKATVSPSNQDFEGNSSTGLQTSAVTSATVFPPVINGGLTDEVTCILIIF
jgi:hypothetical protein